MKKKILLSVFSVFSLMIASKTFAQSYHHERDRTETRKDVYAVQRHQDNISYILNRIDETKAKMARAQYHNNFYAYNRQKEKLAGLYRQLDNERNELAIDMRHVHIDRRTASSSRRF